MRASDQRFHLPARRGSVLIVALLVAALIALVLGSYLSLNLASTRLARRTFLGFAALNLAEAGTEEGVWAFNHVGAPGLSPWDDWTKRSGAAWKQFPAVDFGANTRGTIKVYIDNYAPPSGAQPKVAAQATLAAPGETAVVKLVEVTLRRRSLFANGLVAKNRVVFNGTNTSVDSWNSDPDNSAATAPVPYSAAVRTDHGSVASMAVTSSAVSVNQADVWGYVSTGGSAPQVGAGGSVRGVGTPANVAVDPARVSTDFNADFPLLTAPVDGTLLTSVGSTLGTLHTATRWRCQKISLSGDDTLTILGQVTLILTPGTGGENISVTGNASIIIPDGSSLTIWTEGNVKIAGKGLANGNVQPLSCMVLGTSTSALGQSIEIAGRGDLRAVVYAPSGDVTVVGNGGVMGSIVARTITLAGNAAFHYDESLANYGDATPFGIAKWRELTSAADKARYSGVFDGW
jgi:hypothetical protein